MSDDRATSVAADFVAAYDWLVEHDPQRAAELPVWVVYSFVWREETRGYGDNKVTDHYGYQRAIAIREKAATAENLVKLGTTWRDRQPLYVAAGYRSEADLDYLTVIVNEVVARWKAEAEEEIARRQQEAAAQALQASPAQTVAQRIEEELARAEHGDSDPGDESSSIWREFSGGY